MDHLCRLLVVPIVSKIAYMISEVPMPDSMGFSWAFGYALPLPAWRYILPPALVSGGLIFWIGIRNYSTGKAFALGASFTLGFALYRWGLHRLLEDLRLFDVSKLAIQILTLSFSFMVAAFAIPVVLRRMDEN